MLSTTIFVAYLSSILAVGLSVVILAIADKKKRIRNERKLLPVRVRVFDRKRSKTKGS
jgi:hypothetical protein